MIDFNIFNDEKKSQNGLKWLGSIVTHTFFFCFVLPIFKFNETCNLNQTPEILDLEVVVLPVQEVDDVFDILRCIPNCEGHVWNSSQHQKQMQPRK